MDFVKYITFLCSFYINGARHVDYRVKQCATYSQECVYKTFKYKSENVSLLHHCVNQSLKKIK